MKRSTKFYRKNEADVMKLLGLEPVPNSGSGWIAKEDGESENILCQLKSTDAMSIKVNLNDIHVLEKHSAVSHKLPIFAIQFLASNDVYVLCKPLDLLEVSKYIATGKVDSEAFSEVSEVEQKPIANVIKSSSKAREKFHEEKNKKYEKEKKAW